MNLHQPTRLSPIPRSDETESEYGAEVRDIPFYRPEKKSLDKTSYEPTQNFGTTHEFAALVSPTATTMPIHVPHRTRWVEGSSFHDFWIYRFNPPRNY